MEAGEVFQRRMRFRFQTPSKRHLIGTPPKMQFILKVIYLFYIYIYSILKNARRVRDTAKKSCTYVFITKMNLGQWDIILAQMYYELFIYLLLHRRKYSFTIKRNPLNSSWIIF